MKGKVTKHTVITYLDKASNLCCNNCDAMLPVDGTAIPDTVRISFSKDELDFLLITLLNSHIDMPSEHHLYQKFKQALLKLSFSNKFNL